jgi:glycosyltransferase involved in cell wall biosynthesis
MRAVPDGNRDITAVIANYNYARFLPEAVESLTSQAGGAPRIVVVDDGSTEAGADAALDSAAAAGAEVLRRSNRGVAAARNAGLARVSTPYWLVLDADDRLAPGALAALRAPLEADPRIGYAFGYMRFFGAMSGVVRFPDYDPYRLLFRHTVGLTALARAELLEATGGYDPAFAHYEDWELWVHALAHGYEGRRVETVTLEYRRHDGTKFAGDRRNYRAAWAALRRKHGALYARAGTLATRAGPFERAVYRHFWGPRPVPAGVEAALHRLVWRP